MKWPASVRWLFLVCLQGCLLPVLVDHSLLACRAWLVLLQLLYYVTASFYHEKPQMYSCKPWRLDSVSITVDETYRFGILSITVEPVKICHAFDHNRSESLSRKATRTASIYRRKIPPRQICGRFLAKVHIENAPSYTLVIGVMWSGSHLSYEFVATRHYRI